MKQMVPGSCFPRVHHTPLHQGYLQPMRAHRAEGYAGESEDASGEQGGAERGRGGSHGGHVRRLDERNKIGSFPGCSCRWSRPICPFREGGHLPVGGSDSGAERSPRPTFSKVTFGRAASPFAAFFKGAMGRAASSRPAFSKVTMGRAASPFAAAVAAPPSGRCTLDRRCAEKGVDRLEMNFSTWPLFA